MPVFDLLSFSEVILNLNNSLFSIKIDRDDTKLIAQFQINRVRDYVALL
jgi:hypothetical protein